MFIKLRDQDYFHTKHKYRGFVLVTTFGKDPNKTEPFSYSIDFDNPQLDKAREEGIKWYQETIQGLEREGKYFLPFASPDEFELGKHAAYSVSLSLVETYGQEEYEYDLLGTDEDTMNETIEMEFSLLNNYF